MKPYTPDAKLFQDLFQLPENPFPFLGADEYQRLIAHLTQELKSKELGNRFTVRTLPLNKTISSPQEATATIQKENPFRVRLALLQFRELHQR